MGTLTWGDPPTPAVASYPTLVVWVGKSCSSFTSSLMKKIFNEAFWTVRCA